MNNVNFRTFKKGDYETCCSWWKEWDKSFEGKAISRDLLPDDKRCYLIEKNNTPVACTFLLLSLDVPCIAWTTYLVSNPNYRDKDRGELIRLLVKNVEVEAKNQGVTQLFTVCGDKHMSKIHADLDWMMVPVEHEAHKYL
tara:strand:- start:4117 stop:4536 length:420 start_codon:yes stop_codon:yes gene_type:complete